MTTKNTMCTFRTLDEGNDETLVGVTFTTDAGDALDISVLVNYGEAYTTPDWQGTQPKSLDESDGYAWIRCADWHLFTESETDLRVCAEIVEEIEG